MNYRHVFHAGNFADLIKHAAVDLILDRLTASPAPLLVLDSHAGAGLYDVTGAALCAIAGLALLRGSRRVDPEPGDSRLSPVGAIPETP